MKDRYLGFMLLIIALVTIVILISRRLDLEGIGKSYGYLGIFVISLVSCMTIVFPVPYIPALIVISPFFNPFWMGIFGGTGAAIGEFTGYILGRSGAEIFPQKWRGKIRFAERFFKKYGFWSVVLVTATPLPVGVIYLVAGMAGYSAFRLLIAGVIGKIIFVWAMTYSGHYVYPIPHETAFGVLLILGAGAVLIYFFGGYNWLKRWIGFSSVK